MSALVCLRVRMKRCDRFMSALVCLHIYIYMYIYILYIYIFIYIYIVNHQNGHNSTNIGSINITFSVNES